jgi:hypothetical protein
MVVVFPVTALPPTVESVIVAEPEPVVVGEVNTWRYVPVGL